MGDILAEHSVSHEFVEVQGVDEIQLILAWSRYSGQIHACAVVLFWRVVQGHRARSVK